MPTSNTKQYPRAIKRPGLYLYVPNNASEVVNPQHSGSKEGFSLSEETRLLPETGEKTPYWTIWIGAAYPELMQQNLIFMGLSIDMYLIKYLSRQDELISLPLQIHRDRRHGRRQVLCGAAVHRK